MHPINEYAIFCLQIGKYEHLNLFLFFPSCFLLKHYQLCNCSISFKGTGDDPAAESEYLSGFCNERKIDLTNYIKWWGPNKTRQTEAGTKSVEETKHAGDICVELKTLEWGAQPTEPYQMPHLGMSNEGRKHKGSAVSALSILSRSAAYKSLQEKASKRQDNSSDNDENEDKNAIDKMDYGKAVEKSTSYDVATGRLGVALGMGGGLSLQRNVYPLTPFLSAPLLTNYNTVDPLVDPILWTSLVPVLPTGLPRTAEVGIFSYESFVSNARIKKMPMIIPEK